jgi:hypothetical protein
VPFFVQCNKNVILQTLNICMNKTYRSIFISDVHLGTKDCKAEALNNFLKHNTCETLYLVGDIIDAWKIKQNKWRWKQSHTNVVRRIMGHAKREHKCNLCSWKSRRISKTVFTI